MTMYDKGVELSVELEALGLRIESVMPLPHNDVLLTTEDGVDIYVFDPITGLEPRIEYHDIVYFTDGSEDLAVKIVNAAEAARLARVTR